MRFLAVIVVLVSTVVFTQYAFASSVSKADAMLSLQNSEEAATLSKRVAEAVVLSSEPASSAQGQCYIALGSNASSVSRELFWVAIVLGVAANVTEEFDVRTAENFARVGLLRARDQLRADRESVQRKLAICGHNRVVNEPMQELIALTIKSETFVASVLVRLPE